MKKQAYLTPQCEVVNIKNECLMGMGSNGKAAIYTDDTADKITDEGAVLGRRRRDNDWEDDWEDEEDY